MAVAATTDPAKTSTGDKGEGGGMNDRAGGGHQELSGDDGRGSGAARLGAEMGGAASPNMLKSLLFGANLVQMIAF